ncbi:MAG: hypothetical protein HQK49_11610 [Oligoflexia bacterium]|nr:hypothetical protein [Oligoflexia bacterium]
MSLRSIFISLFVVLMFSNVTLAFALTEGDFLIGADNSNEVIRNLTSLYNDPIAEIERKARPCEYTDWKLCSHGGFLAKDESFIERLIIDNTFVQSKSLSHRKLAEPLIILRNIDPDFCKPTESTLGPSGECIFNGQTYKVQVMCTDGYQYSIFNDGLKSACVVTVQNMKTLKELTYDSDLLPNYIKLYGFYEGETPYRVSPEEIIAFFSL